MESIVIGAAYTFDYPNYGTPDSFPEYTAHSGQTVTVVRQLTLEECDEECQPMFEVRSADGWTGSVNESELTHAPATL